MKNRLYKEYIYDMDDKLYNADSRVDDGHVHNIKQMICKIYADDLVEIAENILKTQFGNKIEEKNKRILFKFYSDKQKKQDIKYRKINPSVSPESSDYVNPFLKNIVSNSFEDAKKEIEYYIELINDSKNDWSFNPEHFFELYDKIKETLPRFRFDPKLKLAIQAIKGDTRKYGVENLDIIIIRGNNFEVRVLDLGTAKKIVKAVYDIFNKENQTVSDILDQEINVYSYVTKVSRTYTLGELERGEIVKTATAPTSQASMYIPPPSFTKELSPTQRHQLRYTSENFSFKNWFVESSVLNPFQTFRPKWVKPDLYEEKEEMVRQAKDLNIDEKTVKIAFIRAKITTLDDTTWFNMQNTDSNDPNISMEKIETWKKDGKAVDRIVTGIKKGEAIPAPMVLIHDGVPYCVAGNTRLSISKVLGVRPKVLLATTF